jgi:hypothetical protein
MKKYRGIHIAILIELERNRNDGLTTTELKNAFVHNHTQKMSLHIRELKKLGYVVKDSIQQKDKREFKHRISDAGLQFLGSYNEEMRYANEREIVGY